MLYLHAPEMDEAIWGPFLRTPHNMPLFRPAHPHSNMLPPACQREPGSRSKRWTSSWLFEGSKSNSNSRSLELTARQTECMIWVCLKMGSPVWTVVLKEPKANQPVLGSPILRHTHMCALQRPITNWWLAQEDITSALPSLYAFRIGLETPLPSQADLCGPSVPRMIRALLQAGQRLRLPLLNVPAREWP